MQSATASVSAKASVAPGPSGTTATNSMTEEAVSTDTVCMWIKDLADVSKRENALLHLSKHREHVNDLALWLWYSYGTVAILLQEIISIYPFIIPPTLTASQSNRVCNALALMQCIASHKDTRKYFLDAKIPLYLYPFLHTTNDARPFEYLRLTSLGVLGALVKTDESEVRTVVKFLLSTEIIPLCLRIMEQGTELSRTVATFILQKVLLDEIGLNYVCQTYERFSHVAMVLGKMVIHIAKEPSPRLLKHLVRCYYRLSENQRALQALTQCLPDQLKNDTFKEQLDTDRQTKEWWKRLMKNLGISAE